MKPRNFPERRRQRQLRALERIKPKARNGDSNTAHIATLVERTSKPLRDVFTKKDRSAASRFAR